MKFSILYYIMHLGFILVIIGFFSLYSKKLQHLSSWILFTGFVFIIGSTTLHLWLKL